MFLYPNVSIQWARVYGPYVDKMFKYGYIEWKYKDARGAYFSTIRLTDTGKERYAKEMKYEDAT